MKFARTLLAIAGVSMVAAPALAAPANTASSLSIAKSVRAGTPVARKSRLAAGGGALIAIVGAAAVIAGIVVIANDGDDSDSN